MKISTRTCAFIVGAVLTASVLPSCSSARNGQLPLASPTASTSSTAPASPASASPKGTSTPTTTATPPETSPSAQSGGADATGCRSSSLSLSQGHTGLYQSNRVSVYYLQNSGTTICTLRGYPGFSFLQASGATVGTPARRDSGTPVTTVTLQPGQRASFLVGSDDPGLAGSACAGDEPKTVQAQVYPPDQTVALHVASAIGSCDLTVQAVAAADG
jgi:hypothetical protein